jgi:hypothetical protein
MHCKYLWDWEKYLQSLHKYFKGSVNIYEAVRNILQSLHKYFKGPVNIYGAGRNIYSSFINILEAL